MHDYYEKLRDHLDQHDQSRIRGLSARDVVNQQYSNTEIRQLVSSLRERPMPTESAFRLASFIYENKQDLIPGEFRRLASDALSDYISSSAGLLDASTVTIFIVWGSHRADHRGICASLLRHSDSSVRSAALSHAGVFLWPHEFPVLFEFRYDSEVSEIGMGGPLRYILRDHALLVLERLTHCPVADGGDCFEDTADGRVAYRSWSAFLNWYEHHKD